MRGSMGPGWTNEDLAAAIEAPDRHERARVALDAPAWLGGLELTGVSSVTVDRTLVDDLPEQTRVVSGSVVAEITVDVDGGTGVNGEPLSAAEYLSPWSTTSPLAGRPRVGATVDVSVEVRPNDIPVSMTQATGIVQSITAPATGAGRMQALDFRDKLRTLVQLPSVPPTLPDGREIEATWLVSFILWKAGRPLSPQPAGARLWWPGHGGGHPFIATPWPDRYTDVCYYTSGKPEESLEYCDGPFHYAIEKPPAGMATVLEAYAAPGAPFRPVKGYLKGRFHMWVRIDAYSSSGDTLFSGWSLDVTTDQAYFSITNTGQMVMEVEPYPQWEEVTGPTVPADGRWHLVGAHYDTQAQRVVFRLDDTDYPVALTLPQGSDSPDDGIPLDGFVTARCAIAEVAMCTGIDESEPWPDYWAATGPLGYVKRSLNTLTGIAPGPPREAWELLRELAAAELGTVWLDQYGNVRYDTRAKLVGTTAQTVQRTISSDDHLLDVRVEERANTVANVVTCPYTPVQLVYGEMWSAPAQVIAVLPGQTLDVPIEFPAGAYDRMTATVSVNSSATGGGAVLADNQETDLWVWYTRNVAGNVQLSLRALGPTTGVLRIYNPRGVTVYFVDADGNPSLTIRGQMVRQYEAADPPEYRDPASIATYGEQPLALSASPWRQRPQFAAGLALALCRDLATLRPQLTSVQITGDPRLEFYDRLRLVDRTGTGIDHDVWVCGMKDQLTRDGYTQELYARLALNRYLIGPGLVGVDIVG